MERSAWATSRTQTLIGPPTQTRRYVMWQVD
jgi:hypothetical protein